MHVGRNSAVAGSTRAVGVTPRARWLPGWRPDAYYEPNSFSGPKEDRCFAESPLPLHVEADRYNHRDGNDHYTQPGNLFRLFNAEQKLRLFDNIAAAMQEVPEEIKLRQIGLFAKCDPAYGAGVARALKLDARGNQGFTRSPRLAPT